MYHGDCYPFYIASTLLSHCFYPLRYSLSNLSTMIYRSRLDLQMDCDSRNYGRGLRSTCIRMSASSVVFLSSLFRCATLTKYLISSSYRPPPTRLLFTRCSSFYSPFPLPPQQNCLQLFQPFFPPASTRGMKPHGFERAPVNVTQKKLLRTTFSGTTVLYFVPTVWTPIVVFIVATLRVILRFSHSVRLRHHLLVSVISLGL